MDLLKKAIVYVRVSSDRQFDNFSVSDQRNLKQLANRYGFLNVEVLEEQGVSGETLVNRPVMRSTLEQIAAARVGALLVTSFSRISRDEDGIDGRLIKKTCKENGCVIITPDKLYDFSNEMDDDLSEFQFFFAKIQKRLNLKPMIKGQYLKAKEDGFVGIPLSVGYEYEWVEVQTPPKGPELKARLVVNETEAEVVRLIHALFPKMIYRQIAEHLNDLMLDGKDRGFPIKLKHIRERRGSTHRPWRMEDIRNIINNRLYIGLLHFNERSRSSYLKSLDPVYVYREELQIVDTDVFERSQRIAQQRRNIAPRSKAFPHLFSGVVCCPYCGGSLGGHRRRSGDIIYICNQYVHSGKAVCRAFSLREGVIKRTLLPILEELIRTTTYEHVEKVGKQRTAKTDDMLVGEIRAELQQIETEWKNLMNYARQGAITPEQLKAENDELVAKRQRLEKDLDSLTRRQTIEQSLLDVVQLFKDNVSNALEELMKNPLRFNTFARLFFKEITLDTENKGMNWRKGLKKTDQRFAHVVRYTFNPLFDAYLSARGYSLPPALQISASSSAPRTVQSAKGHHAYYSRTSPRSRAGHRL